MLRNQVPLFLLNFHIGRGFSVLFSLLLLSFKEARIRTQQDTGHSDMAFLEKLEHNKVGIWKLIK